MNSYMYIFNTTHTNWEGASIRTGVLIKERVINGEDIHEEGWGEVRGSMRKKDCAFQSVFHLVMRL